MMMLMMTMYETMRTKVGEFLDIFPFTRCLASNFNSHTIDRVAIAPEIFLKIHKNGNKMASKCPQAKFKPVENK